MRVVRAPVLPLGAAPRTSPTAARSTSTARRWPTGTWPSTGAPGEAKVRRLQPRLRAARLAVAAHGDRDRQRRHAVHRRLGDDGAEPAGLRDRPGDPSGDPGPARRSTASCSRCSSRAPPATARSPSRSSTPRSVASPIARRLARPARAASSACSTRSAPRSRTGSRCATGPLALIDELERPSRRRSTPASSTRSRRSCAWLADDHFTFLGYREYDLVRGRRRGRAEGRCRTPVSGSCAARPRRRRSRSCGRRRSGSRVHRTRSC